MDEIEAAARAYARGLGIDPDEPFPTVADPGRRAWKDYVGAVLRIRAERAAVGVFARIAEGLEP